MQADEDVNMIAAEDTVPLPNQMESSFSISSL